KAAACAGLGRGAARPLFGVWSLGLRGAAPVLPACRCAINPGQPRVVIGRALTDQTRGDAWSNDVHEVRVVAAAKQPHSRAATQPPLPGPRQRSAFLGGHGALIPAARASLLGTLLPFLLLLRRLPDPLLQLPEVV